MLADFILAMLAGASFSAADLSSCTNAGQIVGMQAQVVRQVTAEPNMAGATSQWVIIGQSDVGDGSELKRAEDGLFYAIGVVNGVPIRFLVDTGASTIVLTAQDAARAGLKPDEHHFRESAETANGQAQMARVTLESLAVGKVQSSQISAAVVREGLGVSLLGQNWLSQLASLTIAGDRMVLR